jgi:abhydrolase domain-containing protein 12
VPTASASQEWTDFYKQQSKRKAKREEIVTHTIIDRFGTLDECQMKGRKVYLLKTRDGGHNMIGTLEGVHDVIQTILL